MTILAIAMIGSGIVLSAKWTIMILSNSRVPDWMRNDFVVAFMAFGFVPVMGLVIAWGFSFGGWLTFWKAIFLVGGPIVALHYIISASSIWKNEPKTISVISIIGIICLLLLAATIPVLLYVSGGIGDWLRWLLGYR